MSDIAQNPETGSEKQTAEIKETVPSYNIYVGCFAQYKGSTTSLRNAKIPFALLTFGDGTAKFWHG